MKKSPLFYTSLSLAIILGLVIGGYIFGEWRVPTQPPPGGNVDLSVFSSDWIKSGNDIYYNKGNVGIGTSTPSYPLEIGNQLRVWGQLISKVASGTAPFVIDSPTLVNNLNADKVDGYNAADLLGGGGGGGAVSITSITTPCTVTGGSGYFSTSDICPKYEPANFIWTETNLSDTDNDGCPESENIPGMCIVRGSNAWIEPMYNQSVIVNLNSNTNQFCPSVNVTLTWTTTNATTCTASGGWSGTKATSGNETINNVTETTTFTLSCTGSSKQPGSANIVVTKKCGSLNFKRVFVTSTTYTGNLDGLAGADSRCQARADAAGLGGTWKAWLSSTSVSASSRLNHYNGEYRLVDSVTKIADNWSDLVDGSLDSPINKDEFGTTRSNSYAWTNTTYSGTVQDTSGQYCCYAWSNTQNSGYIGSTNAIDGAWTISTAQPCTSGYRLYCFEQ